MIENKIFISCPTDNPKVKPMVEDFSSVLAVMLKKVGRKNAIITNSFELEEENKAIDYATVIAESNAVLIWFSEDYLNSVKSQQELSTISALIKNKEKIFKILISDIKLNDQPEFLRNYNPFIFFERINNEIIPANLSGSKNYQNLKIFWLRMIDLTYKIFALSNQGLTEEHKTNVFLAETGSDQFFCREMIRRELEHYGYNVFPKVSGIAKLDNYETYVKENISQTSLSVHVIGSDEGYQVGQDFSVSIQNSMASMHSEENPDYSRLIWIPPDLVFENENQKINIEKLKRDTESLKGAELVQTPIEEFKSLLHKLIRKGENASNQKNLDDNKNNIYLIYNNFQTSLANKLSDELKKRNCNVKALDFTVDKKELLISHRRNLIACDGTIIICDKENENWVDSKRKDILKSIGFGRLAPIKAKSLFINDDTKLDLNMYQDYVIINESKGTLDKDIELFIEKLKQ